MNFSSLASANKAFLKAGLQDSAVIRDDAGTKHEGIDTFYGFSKSIKEQRTRSLGFLAEQVGMKFGKE